MEKTVIYYTSNREDESFEKKIRSKLLATIGDMPLISISQKTLDFGINIWVGDVGACEDNLFRQMLVGCQKAKTDYVVFAEADTLYPPEYFQFDPPYVNKRYWFEDVYIYYPTKNAFYLKGRSDVAHIADREYIISLLEKGLKDRHYWIENKKRLIPYGNNEPTPIRVKLPNPIISIKTGKGLRMKTQTALKGLSSLPYWGKSSDIRKEFFV
jgi:hypothetical protein